MNENKMALYPLNEEQLQDVDGGLCPECAMHNLQIKTAKQSVASLDLIRVQAKYAGSDEIVKTCNSFIASHTKDIARWQGSLDSTQRMHKKLGEVCN